MIIGMNSTRITVVRIFIFHYCAGNLYYNCGDCGGGGLGCGGGGDVDDADDGDL